MILEKFLSIKREITSFTRSERLFIFLAMLCGFCINAGYAVIRPVSESFFMTTYGSGAFPYAWLVGVPANFLLVALYNRYLPRLGCKKIFFISTSGVILSMVFAGFFLGKSHIFPFVFYVWREAFILLMFQQLWSVIHSTIKLDQAKYLYGLFFAFGGLGSIFASALPGFFAVKLGSENILFTSLPIYILLMFLYFYLVNHSPPCREEGWEKKDVSLKGGVQLIFKSKFLIFILLILVCMQLSSTIVNFQFNTILEKTIEGKDLRTEYYGKIHGIGSCLTVVLQVVGSLILVHFLGLKGGHLFMPLFLLMNAIGSLFSPSFRMIAYSYVTIKAFDFSIFGVLKEMLYIPLSQEEKFQAKAWIDMFAYRACKAFASLVILVFPFTFLSWGLMAVFGLWIFIVWRMFKIESNVLLTPLEK